MEPHAEDPPIARALARFWSWPVRWHLVLIGAGLVLAEVLTIDHVHPVQTMGFAFFVPVLLGAFRFDVSGGAVCGALSAVMAGPLAFAIGHASGVVPPPELIFHWTVYAVAVVVLGCLAGGAFGFARSRHERLMAHSLRDASTGLPNLQALRRQVVSLVDTMPVGTAGQGLTKVAVRFTNYQNLVNVFGYAFADEAIRHLAARMRRSMSARDFVARVAPHTLAFVVPGRPDGQLDACHKLLEPEEEHPISVSGIPVFPGLAIGVATSLASVHHIERLFSEAETAATEAEDTSERLVVHSEGARQRQEARVRLLGEFGDALAAGQLMLVYQPRLDLSRNCINGVEALVRWHHPERGWIPPSEFVPLIEETRLVNSLTHWVLESALWQLAAWRANGLDVHLSVNLSARNLFDPELGNRLGGLLSRHGIPAARVELEITESAFVDITMDRLEMLGVLRCLGVGIAIDDFGTGYASIEYLRSLPVDTLKLDKTFILDGLGKPQDHLLVRRMVQMAKDRELRVVAEGVETEDALMAVRQVGCDEAQGFHVARPMDPLQAEHLLCARACCVIGSGGVREHS